MPCGHIFVRTAKPDSRAISLMVIKKDLFSGTAVMTPLYQKEVQKSVSVRRNQPIVTVTCTVLPAGAEVRTLPLTGWPSTVMALTPFSTWAALSTVIS